MGCSLLGLRDGHAYPAHPGAAFPGLSFSSSPSLPSISSPFVPSFLPSLLPYFLLLSFPPFFLPSFSPSLLSSSLPFSSPLRRRGWLLSLQFTSEETEAHKGEGVDLQSQDSDPVPPTALPNLRGPTPSTHCPASRRPHVQGSRSAGPALSKGNRRLCGRAVCASLILSSASLRSASAWGLCKAGPVQ